MTKKTAIVLVGPRGDANIGATARAMKNFGFTDLRLVDSVLHLTKAAYMWAVEARDVLQNASTFSTLDEALADIPCAVAFTRRLGRARKMNMEISKASGWIRKKAALGGVALVFGREDKGLSTSEVRRCDALVTIPTSEKLPSINLAQAVLLACYEISRQRPAKSAAKQEFVPHSEISAVLGRMGTMLGILDYSDDDKLRLKSKIIHQLEKIFGRAGLTVRDVRMFEGLTARIIEKLKVSLSSL